MNDWTAKYRNSGLAGRPSFSNLYSVVNALAGHWNNFGADAPVPKKRIGRITKARPLMLHMQCSSAPAAWYIAACAYGSGLGCAGDVEACARMQRGCVGSGCRWGLMLGS